ncbi:MAG: class I SAM-dependent methyltransferase [Micavibrio sp.]|nr:class I SAM-dependent methyltransferase [Micavibrio sp.]
MQLLSALVAAGVIPHAFAADEQVATTFVTGHSAESNFKSVYNNPGLRNSFFGFLKNVYSIYPPEKFHAMIAEITASNDTDAAIYKELQRRLPEVKSFLQPVTRALPTLAHQKDVLTSQVGELTQDHPHADGYMEIGTTGRYVHGVTKVAGVKGKIYLLHTARPQFFSLDDIVDRGQLTRIGKFVDMGDYKQISSDAVPDESLDLITNFIGFHHAKPEDRDAFISSVVKKLRPGGRLILRDHDVDSENMRYIVALAHDVFNAGLDVPLTIDEEEVRNFTTVPQIEEALHKQGMTRTGNKLLQEGDPTQNTLMLFVKAA